MKKTISIFLSLVMFLSIAVLPVSAADVNVEETAYWDNLTKSEAETLLRSVQNKTAEENVIFFFYRMSGCTNSTNYIPQYASFANENKLKMYAYGYNDNPGSNLNIIFTLLNSNSLTFPATCIYNAQTKTYYAVDAKTVLSLSSLKNKLTEAGVYSGSAPGTSDTPSDSGSDSIVLIHDSDVTEQEWEVLRLVNQHRMSMGLEPLSMFDSLQKAANQRAHECMSVYSHDRPDGSSCFTAYDDYGVSAWSMAENIAYGFRDAEAVMNGWLNSSGHRKNIEASSSTHIGVGHKTSSSAAYSPAWSQNFLGNSSCTHTNLQLSKTSVARVSGQDLETVLKNANITVTASCSVYGSCRLPLIAAMCSGYSEEESGDQTVTVSYGRATTTLTITNVSCTDHSYDSGSVTKAATCADEGIMTYTCKICGGTKNEPIAKLEHTPGRTAVSNGDGTHSFTCTKCGANTSKSLCTYDSGKITKEPTVSAPGIRTYTCTVCGEKKTETIPALKDECASGHTWDSGVVTREPATTSTGIRTYTCTVCGEKKTETIPALGTDSGLTNFVPVNFYDSSTFRDVAPNAWYVDNVSTAYQLGLMKGTGESNFSPGNNMTIAEAVTLAARLHSIYHTGGENFTSYDGGNWYDPYVNYARNNGILSENYNYTQPATREQFVHILAQSLPAEALEPIKGSISFADSGSITYAGDIQLLSRAGVIAGIESGGALYFRPNNTITRAEVAAVVTRMAQPGLRVS